MSLFGDGIQNARIRSTQLGMEPDHGIFIVQVNMDYDGGGQSFQRCLDENDNDGAYQAIAGICRAVGVTYWEQLAGKYCRVKKDGGLIRDIGNIVEDRWSFSTKETE